MSKRRINVRGIVSDANGKILSVLHRNEDGSIAKYWATPGGGLDSLESIEAGLRREFVEELGVEPVIGRLLLIQQFQMGKEDTDEQLEMFFEITNPDDFNNIDLAKTSHGSAEIAQCEFIDVTEHELLPSIIATDQFQKVLSDPAATALLYNELD